MASVDHRETTHPAGLTSLELFDKFKVLDEDKDSDEESFHLPMLDSEEDLSSNSKQFFYICKKNIRTFLFFLPQKHRAIHQFKMVNRKMKF